VLGQVLTEFSGKVRLVYKDFPLTYHENAGPAAEAARCAGEHGHFWEYHDLLFVAQPALSRTDLVTYAYRLGLPQQVFVACLDSGRFRDAVKADLEEGRAAGVSKTPTFFINERRIVGAESLDTFRDAIRAALKEADRRQP